LTSLGIMSAFVDRTSVIDGCLCLSDTHWKLASALIYGPLQSALLSSCDYTCWCWCSLALHQAALSLFFYAYVCPLWSVCDVPFEFFKQIHIRDIGRSLPHLLFVRYLICDLLRLSSVHRDLRASPLCRRRRSSGS
jgi:hypothetical protein